MKKEKELVQFLGGIFRDDFDMLPEEEKEQYLKDAAFSLLDCECGIHNLVIPASEVSSGLDLRVSPGGYPDDEVIVVMDFDEIVFYLVVGGEEE